MKAMTLSAILTFVVSLLVQGLGLEVSHKNVTADTNRRILYGNPANVLDFPFLVGLRTAEGEVCGGSIIHEQWVMSASHCIFGKQCNAIRIAAAVWTSDESVYPIECYTHSQYIPGLMPYDISLLRVGENLVGDGRARTIDLPSPGSNYPPNTPAIGVGWGKTEEGVYPDHLLQANFVVEDWNTCNEKYKMNVAECRENPACIGIPRRAVCTEGNGAMPSSTCFGDSGGPVIINNCVAGIVSYLIRDARGMCGIGTPAIHVKVADYIPWILSYTNPGMDTSQIPVESEN